MKNIATWSAIILLAVSSAGAIYNGYHLISHPDGSSVGLSPEMLKYTPFKNFRIPGILLIISIGIFGMLTIFLIIYQQNFHAKYIIASGFMLTVWMLVHLALTPEIYNLQYVILVIGIAQMLCGFSLDKKYFEMRKKTLRER